MDTDRTRSSGEVGEAFQENDLMGGVFMDGVGAGPVLERDGRVGAGKEFGSQMGTDEHR